MDSYIILNIYIVLYFKTINQHQYVLNTSLFSRYFIFNLKELGDMTESFSNQNEKIICNPDFK